MRPGRNPQQRGDENFGELQTVHPIVPTGSFSTVEDYVLYLLHRKAYEYAAEIASGRSLLDWGCNNGYGMELMRPYVAQIAGLDSAETAILAARRRLPDLQSNIRLYDGNGLPFRPGSFDVVTSFQVIEHVGDLKTYLSHILKALKPGGMAIFTTPNRELRLNPGDRPWNPYHVREFSPSDLKELLARFFSAVEMQGLRAAPAMDSIERSRCEARRTEANRILPPYQRARLTMTTQLKRLLPEPVSNRIRWLVHLRREQIIPETLGTDILSKFSTQMAFYSRSDLNVALDLMAICTK
jgi:SAM-dependent methyltransferase